jgi:hypothetical protein
MLVGSNGASGDVLSLFPNFSKDARAELVMPTNCLTNRWTGSLIDIFFGKAAPSFLIGVLGAADESPDA